MRTHIAGIIFSLLLACFTGPLYPQQNGLFRLIDIHRVETNFFTADHLGNIYYLTCEGLVKHDAPTQTLKHYSNPFSGRISWIDASDPFNILVFYQAFQQIIWLDRNLAQKEGPSVPQYFTADFPSIVCHSFLGGFWAYFPNLNQIRRFNQQFQLQAQSLRLFEILEGFSDPMFMIEADGRLYASDPETGIAVFDAFGNFLSLINRKGLERFQVFGNNLVYFSDKEMIVFDFLLQKETLFLLPETGVKSGLVKGRRIYLQTANDIRIYEARERLF